MTVIVLLLLFTIMYSQRSVFIFSASGYEFVFNSFSHGVSSRDSRVIHRLSSRPGSSKNSALGEIKFCHP